MQPRAPPAPPQPWAELPKLLDLAKRKNAVVKVSGACTLSKEPYPFPDIWDPLARVFDADFAAANEPVRANHAMSGHAAHA